MTPDDTLVVAGHVLTAPVATPPWLTGVPPTVLTISTCFREALPAPPFWDWWVDLEDAELVRARMAPEADITTVALGRDEATGFMDELDGADQPFFEGLRSALPYDGAVLGYEVIGPEATLRFHTWHCHSYADEVREELGIGLTDLGLLGTRSDADAVLAWMLAQPPDKAPEPVPWVVAALGASAP